MIQKGGLQDAFAQAQGMFTSDMARRLQGDMSNQQAGLQAGIANLGSYTSAELANQQASQSAANMREQSGQFGAGLFEQGSQFGADLDYSTAVGNEQLRMQAMDQLQSGTALTASLGLDAQRAEFERLDNLNKVGNVHQARQQDLYDLDYGDFQNQLYHPQQQLTWENQQIGLLNSAPRDAVQYQQNPSTFNQMAAMGLSGLAAYNAWPV